MDIRTVEYYENRIRVLSEKDAVANARIINKMKRKIRQLQK